MNIQHLRHSLKLKWLLYYQQNRPWLVQLRVWGTYDGQRRPSSSFILATLSNLEPELNQLFPFIIALNNNPDQIVAALGLNFNPDTELKSMTSAPSVAKTKVNGNGSTSIPLAETKVNGNGSTSIPLVETKVNGNALSVQSPTVTSEVTVASSTSGSNLTSWVDESCQGKGSPSAGLVLSILVVISSLAFFVVGLNG